MSKIALTGIAIWLANHFMFFKIIGLMSLEDTMAMRLGQLNGITVGNLILTISVAFLIYELQKKKKRGKK